MLRVYICHPYTGDELNNLRDAAWVTWRLHNAVPGVCFINPLDLFQSMEFAPEDQDEVLAMCLSELATCTAAIQCAGWGKSNGCKVEADYARKHGIDLVPIDDVEDYLMEALGTKMKKFKAKCPFCGMEGPMNPKGTSVSAGDKRIMHKFGCSRCGKSFWQHDGVVR